MRTAGVSGFPVSLVLLSLLRRQTIQNDTTGVQRVVPSFSNKLRLMIRPGVFAHPCPQLREEIDVSQGLKKKKKKKTQVSFWKTVGRLQLPFETVFVLCVCGVS